MYKKFFIGSLVIIVLAALGATVFRSSKASSSLIDAEKYYLENRKVEGNTSEQLERTDQSDQYSRSGYMQPASIGLSKAETEGILFMYEEEKLARDVYSALYGKWQLPVFQNIAVSEQTHMDAIMDLFDIYNLYDSAKAEPGIFSNPDLQLLYDELVARGSFSLVEALKVGAEIEEIDILDLQAYLAQTNNPELQKVYSNLLRGSQNHLRAFTKTLFNQTGETYQPQHLAMQEYQSIDVLSFQGRGNENGGQGGWGRGRGGKNY